MNRTNNFTFADICAGIGGFRLGLEMLGGKCVYSCEVDAQCERTYSSNFGHGFNSHDINSIVDSEFPYVDVICAGFPCQPFSIAGKQSGFRDKRGKLFFKLADIIRSSRPKVVFLENVVNLLHIAKGKTFKTIIGEIQSIGYNVYHEILDSADFAVPQSRKRIYIVAFRKDIAVSNFEFTKKRNERIPFRKFIAAGDNSIPISKKWQSYIDLYTGKLSIDEIDFDIPKTRKKLERIDVNADLNDCVFQMRSSGIRALSIDRPLPTLAVSISGGGAMIPVYSKERRHLSLLEMQRLMGFPDNFNFPVSRTHAIKQLANAVCPPVIESIGKDILKSIGKKSSFLTSSVSTLHYV